MIHRTKIQPSAIQRAAAFAGGLAILLVGAFSRAQDNAAPVEKAPAKAAEKPATQTPAENVKATKIRTLEGITEYTLPNGLAVLLYPDPSKPTVTTWG